MSLAGQQRWWRPSSSLQSKQNDRSVVRVSLLAVVHAARRADTAEFFKEDPHDG